MNESKKAAPALPGDIVGSEPRVTALVQLLAEGRMLLQEAQVARPDWPSLLRAEAELRSKLESLLASPVSGREVEAVRIALQEMLSLNKSLIELIEGHRTRTLHALEHKALVRRAANAYSQSAVG
ncbi:hypothetical protein BJI67_05690 [Acidihalobacter aeolianus]|uniref:Flagellar protein FliT n=1 Tax=Acidihalobacter aeolianus TaxID=2792603 RepID=A0A1D8K6L6_9GAMM|nr:hypothetical protein [Acidihalobacter aeolianus]AOV16625.1 hypothetical protein BJI67_05690 [Acidihalobacter aeolianus]